MRAHVIALAERAGCSHVVDGAGNVIVRKPAAPGHEASPVTVLQSHLDMVQEKNADVAHDFATDAIVPQRAGEYLTATGTTLGSDNGIGVATMLAVLEARSRSRTARAAVHDRRGDRAHRRRAARRQPPGRTPADQPRLRGGGVPVRRLRRRRGDAHRARRDAGAGRQRRPGGDAGPDRPQGGPFRLRHPPAARQRRLPAGARPLGGAHGHAVPPRAPRGRERPQRHPARGVRDGRRGRGRRPRARGRGDRGGVRGDSGRVPAGRSRHGARRRRR